jgi:hypothetical protein
VITAATPLGAPIGGRALYELELEVRGEGITPAKVRQRVLVPEGKLSRVVPGSALPVVVGNGSEDDLEIQWERLP